MSATRGWIAAVPAFVVTFLVVRWVLRQVWPDQGSLADAGIDLWRVASCLALATAAAIGAGLASSGRRS